VGILPLDALGLKELQEGLVSVLFSWVWSENLNGESNFFGNSCFKNFELIKYLSFVCLKMVITLLLKVQKYCAPERDSGNSPHTSEVIS